MYSDMAKAPPTIHPCSSPQQECASREPYVAIQIKRLAMMVERLEQDSELVDNKFAAVTRPNGPTMPGNCVPVSNDECTVTPLAGNLLSLGSRLNLVSDRLRNLCDRCEL
jgi:hypothetical protein